MNGSTVSLLYAAMHTCNILHGCQDLRCVTLYYTSRRIMASVIERTKVKFPCFLSAVWISGSLAFPVEKSFHVEPLSWLWWSTLSCVTDRQWSAGALTPVIILESDAFSIIKILVSGGVRHAQQNRGRWSVLLLITSPHANQTIYWRKSFAEPLKWL